MLKAILFDLDDTLLWDEKSVNEAFKETCQLAAEQHPVDPKKLAMRVRHHAEMLYQSYETYEFVKNIGIGTFEAFWGDFQDKGDSYRSEEHTSELQSRGQ